MSKAAHHARFAKRTPAASNAGCANGAFYKSPKASDKVDTSQKLKIEWDTSLGCFSTQGVDIYLYAPYTPKGLLKAWTAIDYNSGSLETELQGSWWNSSVAPITLNLAFVESGSPIFTSPVSQGPLFTATFNTTDYAIKHPVAGSNETVSIGGSSSSSSSSGDDDGGFFQVIGNAYKNSGLPKGSIAAAVLVPLLAIGAGIFAYFRWQRKKEAEKRKRWSAAVDKRMSTLSADWKTLPPNAQSEAIRQSIAIMRNSRASMARMSQVYAEGRPSSTFMVENTEVNAAGIGTRRGTGVGPRQVSMGSAQMANRKSAISFADGTRFSRASSSDVPEVPKLGRPSMDSRSRVSSETQRGRASRAYHTAISAAYPEDYNVHDFDVTMMSPTQKGGPAVIGEKDIRPLDLSRDESVLPALSMMQSNTSTNDLIFLAQSPMDPSFSPIAVPPAAQLSQPAASTVDTKTPSSPAYGNAPAASASGPFADPVIPVEKPSSPPPMSPASPFSAFMRTGSSPAGFMSPDAMLRAYAQRDNGRPGTPMERRVSMTPSSKTSGSGSTGVGSGKIVYPALDAPAAPERIVAEELSVVPGLPPAAAGRTLYQPGQGQSRNTVVSQYSDEDAYGGVGFAA